MGWSVLPWGIVGAVEYLDPLASPHRRIIDGCDWYWLEDGEIRGLETHETWGQFVDPPDVPAGVLKRTGAMPDDVWEVVRRAMLEARTCP